MHFTDKLEGGDFRTYGLIATVVLLKPFSNVLFAAGVKAFPHALAANPAVYVQALVEPLVALGVALQVFWLLGRMALLSRADLSFVVPATSIGYVLSAILAKFLLAEQITIPHWIGILLICFGSAFVGTTRLSTTSEERDWKKSPIPELAAVE